MNVSFSLQLLAHTAQVADMIERRMTVSTDPLEEYWKGAITDGMARMLREVSKDFVGMISMETTLLVQRYQGLTTTRQ